MKARKPWRDEQRGAGAGGVVSLHRNSPAEKRKVQALADAVSREAERRGIPGVALVVVLDEHEPLLTGAVVAGTADALVALMAFGPAQLRGTLQRAAGLSDEEMSAIEDAARNETAS